MHKFQSNFVDVVLLIDDYNWDELLEARCHDTVPRTALFLIEAVSISEHGRKISASQQNSASRKRATRNRCPDGRYLAPPNMQIVFKLHLETGRLQAHTHLNVNKLRFGMQ